MKKVLFLLTLCASFPAMAQENVYRPYVGADYVYSDLNNRGADTYLNSGKFVLGSEYNKYFSTEVFYQKSLTKAQDVSGGKMKSSLWGYGLDMYAYLPLGCAQKIAPYATAGVAKYALKKKVNAAHKNDRDGTGYRFGAGVRYFINANVSLLAGYRYINTDKLSSVDHIDELSIGLRYTF